jgi:hypothetical protein
MAPYVLWLGLPFVGTAVDMLARRTSRPLLVRVGTAALASQPLVSIAILWVLSLAPSHAVAANRMPLWRLDVSRCLRPGAYRPIAELPRGLIFAPLELGPSLLAFTPHSVIGAGYHRADQSILLTERLMRGEPDAARKPILERDITYVMTCADFPSYPQAGSLYNALLTGSPVPWLEPVPMPAGEVLKVWRVRG